MRGSHTTLTLELGQRAAGWEVLGQRQERPGPALDLTGATVKLTAIPMPQRLTTMERFRAANISLPEQRQLGLLWFGSSFFEVDGTIIAPETDGKVSFALSKTDLNGEGRFLARPLVTLASGDIRIPKLLKFTIVGGGF